MNLIQSKTCTKCGIEKSATEFSNDKKKSDGKRSDCKLCQKKYRDDNSFLISQKRKNKLLEIKQNKKQYEEYLVNKREIGNKSWAGKQGKNRSDIILNRELKKAQLIIDREFKKLSRNHTVKKGKSFYSEYHKEKRISDPQYKLIDNLRSRIRKAMRLQNTGKHSGSYNLLGMSGKEFHEYFLSLGYNKDIHTIDHVIPISRFNLTIPEHQLVACHYSNLVPLPHFENYSKSDSLIENWQDKIIEICTARNINHMPIIQYIESGIK